MSNIRLNFYSYDTEVLDIFVNSITKLFKQQEISFSGPILMPVKTKSITLIRSVFIYKRSKEHFCMTIHRRMFEVKEKDFSLYSFHNVVLPTQIKLTIKRI